MIVSAVMMVCLGFDNGQGKMVDHCELQIRHGIEAASYEECSAKADKAAIKIANKREADNIDSFNSYGHGQCMPREVTVELINQARRAVAERDSQIIVREVEIK